MRATTTMALAAMLACMQACDDEGKELIPYHNPYGQDAQPNDDANLSKEDAGTSDSAIEDTQVTDVDLPDGDEDAGDDDGALPDGDVDAEDGDVDAEDGEVIDPVTPPARLCAGGGRIGGGEDLLCLGAGEGAEAPYLRSGRRIRGRGPGHRYP